MKPPRMVKRQGPLSDQVAAWVQPLGTPPADPQVCVHVDTGVSGGGLPQPEERPTSASFTKDQQAEWWLMVDYNFYFLLWILLS